MLPGSILVFYPYMLRCGYPSFVDIMTSLTSPTLYKLPLYSSAEFQCNCKCDNAVALAQQQSGTYWWIICESASRCMACILLTFATAESAGRSFSLSHQQSTALWLLPPSAAQDAT